MPTTTARRVGRETTRVLLLAGVFACIALRPVRADSTILRANDIIHPDSGVYSPSGRVVLWYQGSGMVSLFVNDESVWHTQGAPNADGGLAIMQTDGNFVAYDSSRAPYWDSGTWGHDGAYLAVQDDGYIVIYSPEGTPLWSAPEPPPSPPLDPPAVGDSGSMRPQNAFRPAAIGDAVGLGPVAPRVLATQVAPRSAAIDAFRERLRGDVAADNVGGITAAVVAGDKVIWVEGFGWADRDRRIAAGADTIYRIGSITKTFTAVVLSQLVDRKTIALDDPVEKYFPEVRRFTGARPGAKPITFRQLASHTAGLIREPALAGAASGPIAEWESKVLASIPATSFDALPGERYAYSNIGYGVLGLALSRAARTPFMKLVADGIFTPLGMTRSTFILTRRLWPGLSVGYANSGARIDAELPAREHLGRGYKVPNGGVYSTVGDLARFIGALDGAGKTVTSAAMRREMLTKQTPEADDAGYGLGLQFLSSPGAATLAGHSGGVAGYTAHIQFDPQSAIGVILLRNYESGRTNLVGAASQLLRALVAESAK